MKSLSNYMTGDKRGWQPSRLKGQRLPFVMASTDKPISVISLTQKGYLSSLCLCQGWDEGDEEPLGRRQTKWVTSVDSHSFKLASHLAKWISVGGCPAFPIALGAWLL